MLLCAQLCTHASIMPGRRISDLDAAVGDADVLVRVQAACAWLLGRARLTEAL